LASGNSTQGAPRWPSLQKVLEKWRDAPLEAIERAAESNDLTAQHYLGYCYSEGWRFQQDSRKGIAWYQRAGKAGYMPSFSNLGLLYQQGKGVPQDYAKMLDYYRLAADGGLTKAQVNIGYLYRDGIGVQRDPVEAMNWFRRAADQGDPIAMVEIGRPEAAFRIYEQSAEGGDAEAMYALACDYNAGNGVAPDREKAAAWMTKAAEAGNAAAQCEVGFRYENPPRDPSKPVRMNLPQAVKWYRLAADQNNAGGQYRLGLCYLAGQGVEKDEERGLDLIRRAAEKNGPAPLIELARLYAMGVGEPRNDQDRPMQLLQRAAQDASEWGWGAYRALIFRCQYGPATDRDLIAAVQWYCRAALAGVEGCSLVDKLETGQTKLRPMASFKVERETECALLSIRLPDNGGPSDRFLAVMSLYLKAARRNDSQALTQIGQMYAAGRDVPVSAAKAWPWFTLAAQRGDTRADAEIAKIEQSMTKDELNNARQSLASLVQELKAVASALAAVPGNQNGNSNAITP